VTHPNAQPVSERREPGDDYYVCANCAYTWGSPEPPNRCENCYGASSWLEAFPTLDQAEDYSEEVLAWGPVA